MSTALSVPAATKIVLPEAIEAALMHGDLSKLDTPGRLMYYKAVCESLGLNPLTKPFDYITLNGKLTLYAKRDCTDQLRRIHSVSITNLEPKQVGTLFVVTANAKDGTGRTDTSTGAVSTENLKGEALANAMMKAETKAKRRVTLSLCGLGLLDETEVETIPDAQSFREPAPPATQPATTATSPSNGQTEAKKSSDNRIAGRVKDVAVKQTKEGNKEYMLVSFEKPVDGYSAAFCWHKSLFAALNFTPNNFCRFKVQESKGRLTIEDVLEVNGQPYRESKPFIENPDAEPVEDRANTEITDADLPEELFA